MQRAELMDADIVATGHYARVRKYGNHYQLLAGSDPLKDQSYVLYTLSQQQLAKLSLPIGDYSKDEIREVAREIGLSIADKPDSQDICFIPDGDYSRFIEPRLKRKSPGEIVDMNGAVLGVHDGVHGFTVGQRKRIPVANNSPRPLYVTDIDALSGRITVGPAERLMKTRLYASNVNWINQPSSDRRIKVRARIRYNGHNTSANVRVLPNGAEIEFSKPVRAITPGQAVVFYDQDVVLGGGLIEASLPESADDKIYRPSAITV
jgi:tRNA-specific 2-thiouridylase